MKSISITVNNLTPTLVIAADNINRHVYLYSTGNDIFVGNESVTTTTGFNIKKDTYLEIIIPANETLYAITASVGSHSMQVLTRDVD